jgi:hypothetical protein
VNHPSIMRVLNPSSTGFRMSIVALGLADHALLSMLRACKRLRTPSPTRQVYRQVKSQAGKRLKDAEEDQGTALLHR